MHVRYQVELNQCERDRLTALLSGRHATRKLKRAKILLAADADASDEDIARDVAGCLPCTGSRAASYSATCMFGETRPSSPAKSSSAWPKTI